MAELNADALQYFEYRAVNELRKAHRHEHGNALQAMILFGGGLVSSDSYDVNILEVVSGWQGLRQWSTSNSPELTLRGYLRLYFLTPEQFEQGGDENVTALLDEVRAGYAVLLEAHENYVSDTLFPRPRFAQENTSTAGNPLSLQGIR